MKLKDKKDVIIKMYIEDGLSTVKIAEKLGCTWSGIQSLLRRNNVILRSLSQSHIINDRPKIILDFSVINGSLLGDAALEKRWKNSTLASFTKSNIHKNHILYIANKLNIPYNRIKKQKYKDGMENKHNPNQIGYCYKITSLGYIELYDLYNKWYIGEGKDKRKIIPHDLEITSEVLLNWFLDDGYSVKRSDSKCGNFNVYFCTDCFTLQELEMMQSKMLQSFNLKPNIVKHKGYKRLKLNQADSINFLEIIGSCPIPELEYKWKMKNY